MKKITLNILKTAYFSICFFFLFSNSAHAYLDPSATTYIIQAVAAVCIALGAAVTVFRHKITSFFKGKKNTEKREIHIKEETAEDEDHQ